MFKKFQALGKAIKNVKTNVPKTEVQKKLRDLKISTQKLKGSKAKLDQSIFEMKTGQPFTFKKSTKKSESNKEKYKRIQGENTKVIKGMIDKAVENKKEGGRIGRKFGSPDPKKQNIEKINKTFNVQKSDLNKDGKLSGYEKKRGKAIAQAMRKK